MIAKKTRLESKPQEHAYFQAGVLSRATAAGRQVSMSCKKGKKVQYLERCVALIGGGSVVDVVRPL